MAPRKRTLVVAGAVVMLAVLGFAGWWFFIRDDAPDPVDIDRAAEGVDDEAGADTTETDGVWSVDPEVGDFADFSSSFVGYRVQEELATIGANTAVGRTPAVTGTMQIEGTSIESVVVEADLTQLVSDESRRDGQLRTRGLETDTFPTATFALLESIELDAIPAAGETISETAHGELTVHGVTNEVEVPLEARLVDDVIAVTGELELELGDYGIEPPTTAIVLSVSEDATLELQLFFTKVAEGH